MARKRLQIGLGPSEELVLARVWGLGSSDSEIGRKAISLLGRLAIAIQDGFTVAIVPGDEVRYADALPELTDAVTPERRYRYLVSVRHPWRRQLSLKGRRITVAQLMTQMRVNGLTTSEAAREFDIEVEAVAEALEYASNYGKRLEAEAAENRRRSGPATIAPPR